jgi:hypothetical protein
VNNFMGIGEKTVNNPNAPIRQALDFMGIPVVVTYIPRDEVWLVSSAGVVTKIVNIGNANGDDLSRCIGEMK